MKKANFVKFITIFSLLIFCVLTLLAIYATAPPQSSILLLDENFNVLDESKWKHEISECKEDGEQYHYMMGKEENRLIADGVLMIQSNSTDIQFRGKRETLINCTSCVNSKNSSADCFSAELQTRNMFNASCGRIEVRAKLRSENLIRFCIEIKPSRNNSENEKDLKISLKSANETNTNNFAEFEISFETASNKTVIKSPVADDEFHIYEINWDAEKISLNIDKQKVDEKELKLTDLKEENLTNKTIKFNNPPFYEPFYLNIRVDSQRKNQTNLGTPEDKKRSLEDSDQYDVKDLNDETFFEMDYIRLFRILN